jgi:hypothetical protein
MLHKRIKLIGLIVCLCAQVGLAQKAEPLTNADLPEPVNKLLIDAGNAASDIKCYEILDSISKRDDLPKAFAEDLENFKQMVFCWAYGVQQPGQEKKDNYLSFVLRYSITKSHAPKSSGKTLLGDLHRIYAGRTALGGYVQNFGKFKNDADRRNKVLKGIYQNFKRASQVFPENELCAMYANNKMLPWPTVYPDDPAAPQWANFQRRGLEGLTDVIHWWADNRQRPGGFFGSGWGDDVEMWRQWVPVLAGFDDAKANQSQHKLATSLLAQPHLAKGFTNIMTDVEHNAEDTSDILSPMLLVYPDDPQWAEHTRKIVDLAQANWMAQNERGQWQHKSAWFNVDKVDMTPQHTADTTYHCRLYQPAYLLWQRTADPELTAYFTKWMDTWCDAAMRSERGKPAGIVPTTIHWPDGNVGGLNDPWWDPNVLNGVLYEWPSSTATRMLCNTMLLCWLNTGDEKYIKPIKIMAQISQQYMDGSIPRQDEPGTLGWCAPRLDEFLLPVLAKYRLLSGDTQFDRLLNEHASGYMQMRLTGGMDQLLAELKENAAALSQNMELYTSECRAGDRLFVTPHRYFNINQNVKKIADPKIETMYAMVTGDPDMSMYGQIAAVRWMTSPRQLAVMVTDADKHQLVAELFHFGEKPRKIPASLFMLANGKFHWQLVDIQDGKTNVIEEGDLNRDQPASQVTFNLPSRRLCKFIITGKSS